MVIDNANWWRGKVYTGATYKINTIVQYHLKIGLESAGVASLSSN